MTSGTVLTTMMGLAAVLAAFAVLVQVVQEVYKYLTSSKYRAYRDALIDFAGPWAEQLLRPQVASGLMLRGPFQLRRLGSEAKLLPLGRDGLVRALERTAPAWVTRTLEVLRLEDSIAAARPEDQSWSPAWSKLLRELDAVQPSDPNYSSAKEVLDFLREWGIATGNTASQGVTVEKYSRPAALLCAFRSHFLPHVERVERDHPQLETNFDYTYRRRNLRQTFTIALGIALVFNCPLDQLYRLATRLSPDQAEALAESAGQLQKQFDTIRRSTLESTKQRGAGDQARAIAAERLTGTTGEQIATLLNGTRALVEKIESTVSLDDFKYVRRARHDFAGNLLYLLGCVLTALLASFGAPFWNDLGGTLLRLSRRSAQTTQD